MSEQDNIQVVKDIFAAFGRRDLQGILDRLTDDIEWRIAAPTEVARAGPRRGKQQVVELFMQLAQASDFEQFEPQEYIAQGDKVVALGHERQRVKATGQVAEADWAMVFTLREGQVARYRSYEDTSASAAQGGA